MSSIADRRRTYPQSYCRAPEWLHRPDGDIGNVDALSEWVHSPYDLAAFARVLFEQRHVRKAPAFQTDECITSRAD